MEVYRIVVKYNHKWCVGLIKYNTQQEADNRKDQLIRLGLSPNDIKVKSETELFN
jgi:hypothetical protein